MRVTPRCAAAAVIVKRDLAFPFRPFRVTLTKEVLRKKTFGRNSKLKENLLFSQRLRKLMDDRGLKNLALAKAVNVSHVAIGNYRRGQLPKSEHLIALSRFFGVPMDFFFEGGATRIQETAPAYRCRLTPRALQQVRRRIDAAVAEAFDVLEKRLADEP